MSVHSYPKTVNDYLRRLDYLAEVERKYHKGELDINEGETYFELREQVHPPMQAIITELRERRGQPFTIHDIGNG